MLSINSLYKIGYGPSSSHTMGPKNAARIFAERNPNADLFRVTLYGSLAATGRGHLTDKAIISAVSPRKAEIIWHPGQVLPLHPNGMEFSAVEKDIVTDTWQVYSIGGGEIRDKDSFDKKEEDIYPHSKLLDILWHIRSGRNTLWEYVRQNEPESTWEYLNNVWAAMQTTIYKGISAEGILPGGLNVERKARSFFTKNDFIFAFALACAEENASGGQVVTAPTCGSCGVLPAVLLFLQRNYDFKDDDIVKALATAGLIGNLVRANASISGAEVGCQGEIGTATSMAAAAAAQLLGGSPDKIEYAAEIGMEHQLGLTCDPVSGLVQIPCIERNALAATRALDSAVYALASEGSHRISFDLVVRTMYQTGLDLGRGYRETAEKGLAKETGMTRPQ